MHARATAVVGVLLTLGAAACRAPEGTAPPTPTAERGRVAVLPLRVRGFLDAKGQFVAVQDAGDMPDDLGVYVAERLTVSLDELGQPVVPAARVVEATPVPGAAIYDPRLAARVARDLGAEVAVMGAIRRFVQRDGSALSVEAPASVEYQAMIVAADSGVVVGTYLFDFTQKPLAADLTTLPDFVQGGGKWRTREDILDQSIPKMAKKIRSTLRGRAATTIGPKADS
jgi:hypothetical protein